VLVDGGSDDATIEKAKPYIDRLVISEAGRAKQMNVGADIADGEMLLFLHADTFLPHDAVEQIKFAIDTGYDWGRFDIRLIGNHILLPLIASLMNFRSALTQIATGDQALFVNKALFARVGQYPEIALMEDITLSKALKSESRPCCIHSRVETSARRWVQFGVIKTVLLMWWCRLQYFFGVSPSYLQRLYQGGQFWIR
jgi:rSAM/selenodomain-associated transferase 2